MTPTDKLITDNLWRDISEAPRDGETILLADMTVLPAAMLDDYWYQDRVMGGFDNWGEVYDGKSPTHFRPLPDDRCANALKVAVDAIRKRIAELEFNTANGKRGSSYDKSVLDELRRDLAEINRIAGGE